MLKRLRNSLRNKRLSARRVFSDVYANNKWGSDGEFCSGPGSYSEYAIPYVEALKQHINGSNNEGITLVDLGCGDFQVGARLVSELPISQYHGVDVVPSLIDYNINQFADEKTMFSCLDLAEDELPEGNVACIRQVLQHLSNDQIQRVCEKFGQYEKVFITEHYPAKIKRKNKDIVHGQGTRRKKKSGVFLDEEPFNLKNLKQILKINYKKKGEQLVTYLYTP